MPHQPQNFANALSAKLASRARHVLFAGAGASRTCGLPAIATLEGKVVAGLSDAKKPLFDTQLTRRNLEQALSRLRRIVALLDGGADAADRLDATTASELDSEICRLIVENLSVNGADLVPMLRLSA